MVGTRRRGKSIRINCAAAGAAAATAECVSKQLLECGLRERRKEGREIGGCGRTEWNGSRRRRWQQRKRRTKGEVEMRIRLPPPPPSSVESALSTFTRLRRVYDKC